MQASRAVRAIGGLGAGVVPPSPRYVEHVARTEHLAPHLLPGRLHVRLRILHEREAAGFAVEVPALCAGDLQDEHVVVVPVRCEAAGRRPGGIEVDPGVAAQGFLEGIDQRTNGGMEILDPAQDDGGALAQKGRHPPVIERDFAHAAPSPSEAEVRGGVVALGDRPAVPDEAHPALPETQGEQLVERLPGAKRGEARVLRAKQDRALVPVAGIEELLRGQRSDDFVEPGCISGLAGTRYEHLDRRGIPSSGLLTVRLREGHPKCRAESRRRTAPDGGDGSGGACRVPGAGRRGRAGREGKTLKTSGTGRMHGKERSGVQPSSSSFFSDAFVPAGSPAAVSGTISMLIRGTGRAASPADSARR